MSQLFLFAACNILHGIWARLYECGFRKYKNISETQRQKLIAKKVAEWLKEGRIVLLSEVSGDQLKMFQSLPMENNLLFDKYPEVPENDHPDFKMENPEEGIAVIYNTANKQYNLENMWGEFVHFGNISGNEGKGFYYAEITNKVAVMSIHISFVDEQFKKEIVAMYRFAERKLEETDIETVVIGGDFNHSIEDIKAELNSIAGFPIKYTSGKTITRPQWSEKPHCECIDHFILIGKGDFISTGNNPPEKAEDMGDLSDHRALFVSVCV